MMTTRISTQAKRRNSSPSKTIAPKKKDSEEAGPNNYEEHHLDPQLCGQACEKFAGGKDFRASLAAG